MASDDWFRNTDWSDSIERAFFAKLARARNKSQYLRVQACTIAHKQPEVALKLLDDYFSLEDRLFDAQAHVDRATALLSLGRLEEALKSYEEALAVEERRPNVLTGAYILYPFTVAVRDVKDRFERAALLLQHHQTRLTFPVERFQWHAAQALIAADQGRANDASTHARRALDEAARDHSAFRNHPGIGLVGTAYGELKERLALLSHVVKTV